jgi:hypothetical protein
MALAMESIAKGSATFWRGRKKVKRIEGCGEGFSPFCYLEYLLCK